jgi:hypothetical protein
MYLSDEQRIAVDVVGVEDEANEGDDAELKRN